MDFTIRDLTGGLNDTDAPNAIADDQVTAIDNVEFHKAKLGSKRQGTEVVDLDTFDDDTDETAVTFLFRHLPTTFEEDAELWALNVDIDPSGAQDYTLGRKTTAWTLITPSPADEIDVDDTYLAYGLSAVSAHGKMFLAYRTVAGTDRMHVWDGTTLRRTGLAEPSAPSVAETGAGSFSGIRYYRVRYSVISGSEVLRQSEPSDTTTYDPADSGSNGASARITKPATISESETHWRVEASLNNADFYALDWTAVGTTIFDDSVAFATGYRSAGYDLAEDVGDYTVQRSAVYLAFDEDRLLLGGSWEDNSLASRVSWTPVFGDLTGYGNDEREPLDTDQFLDLDTYQNGILTGLIAGVRGYVYAFKPGAIYKLVRTGDRAKAYEAFPITRQRGAIHGSVIEGVDEQGQACIYFLDPVVGPCMLGAKGLVQCGYDIQTLWSTVNLDATRTCHGLYYSKRRQVHYWIATGSSVYPDKRIVLQVDSMVQDRGKGMRRGWAVWEEGRSNTAHSSCMFAENIDDDTDRSLHLRPFVGLAVLAGNRDLIQICDADGVETDSGDNFNAYLKTKPFAFNGMLNKAGVMAGGILATASSGTKIDIDIVRDFGKETVSVEDISLTPEGSETHVYVPIDNLSLSSGHYFQFKFTDENVASNDLGLWELHEFAAKIRKEETP